MGEARKELNSLLGQQETYWKQRAKQHWMKAGDSNTKFFHTLLLESKKKLIMKLKMDSGEWETWEGGLQELITNYFQDLFTSSSCDADPILRNVDRRVANSENRFLLADFDAQEIKDVIFSMHRDKSPGPDGMNPGFFQSYWDVVGEHVTKACLEVLKYKSLSKEWNETWIMLIPPKKKRLEKISDLRPISLCNVLCIKSWKKLWQKGLLELWLIIEKVAHYWNDGYTIEKVAHYWNGGYTIGMVTILLKRWLTIGMVAIIFLYKLISSSFVIIPSISSHTSYTSLNGREKGSRVKKER